LAWYFHTAPHTQTHTIATSNIHRTCLQAVDKLAASATQKQVVKVILQKTVLPPHTGQFNSIQQVVPVCTPTRRCSIGPTASPQSKWYLDRFSHFCRTHYCWQTDRPTAHATQTVTTSMYVVLRCGLIMLRSVWFDLVFQSYSNSKLRLVFYFWDFWNRFLKMTRPSVTALKRQLCKNALMKNSHFTTSHSKTFKS